ncbi:MAG: transcriptional regulator, CdaR [Lacrimispora sp.]|nr:transcriptional regulator, CdaR [Lacrimispora sp.]
MAKHMKNLADFLKNYSYHCHISNDFIIRSCRCLDGSPEVFCSDIIYIAHVSDLPDSLPVSEAVNLLLIGDKELPRSFGAENKNNWILCDPSLVTLPKLMNLTEEFFSEELTLYQYKDEMVGALNDPDAMKKMLEVTYKYVGNPLRVIDSAHNPVVSCWNEEQLDEPQWLEYKENQIFSQKYNDICNADYAFQRHMLNSPTPYIMNYPEIYKHRQRIVRIRQSHMNIAFVSELEYNRPFTEFASEVLQVFAHFAGIRLCNDVRFYCSYDSPLSEILLYVLKTQLPNPEKTRQLMKKFNLHFKKYLYIIYITDDDLFDSREKMVYICTLLDKFFIGGLTQMIEGKIVILLDSEQCIKSPLDDDRLQNFLQILNANHIFAGISRAFLNLSQACYALEQAKKAFDFSKQKEGLGPLFFYEDYILEDLAETYLLHNPPVHIVEPGLNELMEYDRLHGAALMETLTCYLDHQLDLHAANPCISTLIH